MQTGNVRVFQYNGKVGWVQQGQDLDGQSAFDLFGGSTVISNNGSVVAGGALQTGENPGYVQIFHR